MNSVKRIYYLIKRGLIIPYAIPSDFGGKRKSWQSSSYYFYLWFLLFAFSMGILRSTDFYSYESNVNGMVYGAVFALIWPFVMTREHCKKINRGFAILQPATITEKFLAFAIISLIVLPIHYICSSAIGFYLGHVLGSGLFHGNFIWAYDWSRVSLYVTPITVSLFFAATSFSLFVSLLIKNEKLQLVGMAAVLIPVVLAVPFMLGVYESGILPQLFSNTAAYVVYPLVAIAFLFGSFITLKRERA